MVTHDGPTLYATSDPLNKVNDMVRLSLERTDEEICILYHTFNVVFSKAK